jgi:hypothetical protein
MRIQPQKAQGRLFNARVLSSNPVVLLVSLLGEMELLGEIELADEIESTSAAVIPQSESHTDKKEAITCERRKCTQDGREFESHWVRVPSHAREIEHMSSMAA